MSRKTLMTVLGFLAVVLGYLGTQFGLTIDLAALFSTLALVLTYVFGEMKLDFNRVRDQLGKFTDSKFLIAFIGFAVTQANIFFNWNLPTELIVGVLSAILGIIFKKENDALKANTA